MGRFKSSTNLKTKQIFFSLAFITLTSTPRFAFSHEACDADPKAEIVQCSDEPIKTAPTSTSIDSKEFGAPIDTAKLQSLELKEAVTRLSNNAGKEVLLKAEISQVCQKKGCWAILHQDDTEVRMTFKDYGFFLPKNTKGRKVLALGKLQEKEISAATARHYLQDAGAKKDDIEKIKGPQKELSFVASGVRFVD